MKAERKEAMIKNWYKFSAGGVSVIGLAIVLLIILLARSEERRVGKEC